MPHGKKMKVKSKEEVISIKELIHDMDMLRWDHPTVLQAFRVAKGLQKWLSATVEDPPLVFVTTSEPVLSVTIGDICVWENQCCDEDDLTLDACKKAYREEVLKLAAPLEL